LLRDEKREINVSIKVFLVTWKSPQAVRTLPPAMHIHPCAVYTITLHQQQPSTRDISATMAPIDEAIAFLRSSDQSPIAEVVRRFNVNRSTLSKQFQWKTGSAKKAGSNQLPSNKQELVLVEYTRRLSNGVYLLHHQWRLSGPLSCVDRSLGKNGSPSVRSLTTLQTTTPSSLLKSSTRLLSIQANLDPYILGDSLMPSSAPCGLSPHA
jgi:hypothetical protein